MQNIDVKIKLDSCNMMAYLNGEIDHHTASYIRSILDVEIENNKPKHLILDFTNISFMDSSGIGLVLGRYKIMKYIGGSLKIINPSSKIRKVMSLAGFDKLAIIEKIKPIRRSDYIGKK